MKNPVAVALGRLARGVPKKYSKAERKRRGERIRLAQIKWKKEKKNEN